MFSIFSSRPDHPLADAKELKRILSELPLDNPFKAVDEVCGWFDSLHRVDDFRVDDYVEVVRQLDEAAQPHLRRLARDYLHSPRLSKTEERRLWSINSAYWGKVAGLYAYAIERNKQGSKSSDALGPVLPLVATRLLAARAAQLKWVEYRYGPINHALWSVLGETYLEAETAGYAQKLVQLYPSQPGTTSVSLQYLQALVLHASSMDSLVPLEIELADRLISQFLPYFVFSNVSQADSVYWIDAAQGNPPSRLARQPNELTPSLRFFAPGSAPQVLQELIHKVERGDVPADLNLGGQYSTKALLPVLRHLALYWAPQPPLRAHQRHSVKTRMAVLHGFEDSFAVFSGDSGRQQVESQAESWTVENVSLGGFGAVLESLRGDWLRVGSLLCMQPEGGENWVLGIVRRYNKKSDSLANVGIQSISRQALSIELRPRASGFSATSNILGIWLREVITPSEMRLILPAASFDLRESLEFSHDNRSYLLTPITLEESGADYEIARYREHIAE